MSNNSQSAKESKENTTEQIIKAVDTKAAPGRRLAIDLFNKNPPVQSLCDPAPMDFLVDQAKMFLFFFDGINSQSGWTRSNASSIAHATATLADQDDYLYY